MAANKRTEQEVVLKYLVEQATQAKVEAANDAIKKSLMGIEKAAKTGGVVGASEMRRVAKETKKLRKELIEAEDGFHDIGSAAPKELQDVIEQVDRLNKSLRGTSKEVNTLDDQFGKVSKDVALAGDVESQARTIGGGIGALGGRGAERAIGLGAELPAVIEALPKLKASVVGLPAAAKSAADALGSKGIGLAAIAIGAGLAIAHVTKGLKAQVEAFKKLNEVQNQFIEDTITGTADEAQATLDAALTRREVAQANKDQAEKDLAAARVTEQSLDDVSKGILAVGALFVETPISVLEKDLAKWSVEVTAADEVINRYSEGLAEGAFQTEAAAEAQERMNAATADQNARLIASAKAEGDILRTRQGLIEQSTEQLNARNKTIEEEIAVLELEQKRIQDGVQITEEAIEQLNNYEKALQALKIEQAFINETALDLAKTREEEAEQTKALAEAEEGLLRTREIERAKTASFLKSQLQERARIEQEHADALIAISEKTADESARALQKLESKLSDLSRDLGRDLTDQQRKAQRKILEAQIEAQREQVQDFTDHTRALKDIRRQADTDSLSAQQSRDFKSVFNIRRKARTDIQTQQREFIREQADTTKKLQQDRDDRVREFANEREDRMRKFAQATSDARMQFATEQALAQQNAHAAIIIRRSQYQQELVDLQQTSLTVLQMRRSFATAELDIIRNMVSNAGQLFGQLQSQSFGAFSNATTNVSNSTSTTNVGGINVSGEQQQAGQVAQNLFGILQGLAR